jgi:hypothetical protein
MQIEEGMLFSKKGARPKQEQQAKRRRTEVATPVSEPEKVEDEATWAALADLYMQLGEQHVAHVMYATQLAR